MLTRKEWGIALLGGMALMFVMTLVIVSCEAPYRSPQPPQPVEPLGVYPAGTPTPLNYEAGWVLMRRFDGETATAVPGQSAYHYMAYWGTAQPDATGTPSWAKAATAVANNNTLGGKTWLSLDFYESSFQPAAVATDMVALPAGVPTVTYYTSPAACTEHAPDYSSQVFQDAYDAAVVSFTNQFDANANVAGYFLHLGTTLETMNSSNNANKNDGTCPTNYQTAYEVAVACSEFTDWVEHAMQVWRANTTKMLLVSTYEAMCSGINVRPSGAIIAENSLQRAFATPGPTFTPNLTASPTPSPTPLYIGMSSSGLAGEDIGGDLWSAQLYRLYAGQGNWEYMTYWEDLGGSMMWPSYPPTIYNATLRTGAGRELTYAALALGVDVLGFDDVWLPNISADAWYAVTRTIGTDMSDAPDVWTLLRAATFAKVSGTNTDYSGWDGPYHKGIEVVAGTPTPYCAPALATAIAEQKTDTGASEPPYTCKTVITTPAVTAVPEAYNGYFYPASTTVGFDINDTWAARWGTTATVTVSVTYLDLGVDTFTLRWQTAGEAEETHIVTKANTGLAVTETVVISAELDDGLATGGDLELDTGTGGEYLSLFYVTAATAGATPTPSSTPTPSVTPTASTTLTPSPTPTAIATPQACPELAITVDGSLADFTDVTPVPVNPTPGAYSYAVGTPVANGGAFYCAHDGSNLYIGGILTDGTIKTPSFGLTAGDAVELVLDGRADGSGQPGYDDHDLIVSVDGRVRDYQVLPIGVTVATVTGSPGWTFEAKIPAALLQDPDATLTSGQQIGAVYVIINRNDDGTQYDDMRTSHKYSLRLQ